MTYTPQQLQEIQFWKTTYQNKGSLDAYFQLRREDYEWKTKYFRDELENEKGHLGLDLGCGCLSIFEFSDLQMIAVDPLNSEYKRILPEETGLRVKVAYLQNDDERLPFMDETIDFICCFNVIDHTPDSSKQIEEMLRVLRPGGRLYFEVNFDDTLGAPHHTLWTLETVRQMISAERWELKKEQTWRNENFPQSIYEALYIKKI